LNWRHLIDLKNNIVPARQFGQDHQPGSITAKEEKALNALREYTTDLFPASKAR